MSRKKGKASQRIHDWQHELRSGTKSERTAGRSRHKQRAVKLPSNRLEFPEQNLEMLPKVEGLVVGFFPGGAIVRVNGQDMICGIVKTFRAPEGTSALAVGDMVTLALARAEHASAAGEDKGRADGLILNRQARKSALDRPAPRSGTRTDKYETETKEKVIVANMDMLVIVSSVVQPAFRAAVVDRFLIIAERSELQPLLVVNKIDLADLLGADLEGMRRDCAIARPVKPTVFTDLRIGTSLDALTDELLRGVMLTARA